MTNPYDLNPAVAAARAIMISQSRHRNTKEKPLTIREAAKRYTASKSAIGRHLKSMKLFGKPAFSDNSVGRPRNLDEAEERAVTAYIMWLERAGFPCNQLLIEEAANTLRASRTPPEGPVGNGWYRRFLADNPQLQKKKLVRAFDRERAGFEAGDINDLQEFYTNLGVVVEERDIEASQMFNADECGIRIGAIRERLEVIIVKKMLNAQHEVVAFSNRESSTMLGCVNAAGFMIPPLMVFKTWPTESWDVDALDESIRFARSDTGFSNAEISMDWIRHFNRNSFECTTKAQSRSVTFTDWFGCDEFMRDIDNPDFIWKEPFFERPEKERIWRLLVIDGFTGKTSLELMEYCIRFDIEIIILPPHSTHLTQPLDVGVFQLLKNAHQKRLRRHLREGYLNFKRSDFISKLSEILKEAFTVHNIMNGFEKSGIFPVDGRAVIQSVKEKKKSLLATTNPALQSLLPKETRFKDAREVSRHLKRNYRDSFSSPTRESFGILDDVVCEAVLLNSFAEEHIQTRLQRIAATNNKRNKRKKVMPTGKYINSVTVEQVRESLAASTKKDQEDELRRQRKNLKQLHKEEEDRLREEWKKNYKYDINNNGKPIHISFDRWKKWKQLDIVDEIIYIPPPSREASPNPEKGFFYDTSGSAQQKRFYERLRDASAAGFYRSPLQDMPAVPSSDGVEISLGNSQRDATRDSLTFGDSDDSEDDEEAPEFVDLSQDIEEPELPPLPPPLPSFEQDFSSSYHRIMNILHPQRHTQ
ncbi:transposase [Fusarium oxysporum f. sp. phaseoli]